MIPQTATLSHEPVQDVVLFNQTDDDGFMECTGKEIVFENMTFLQLGGYDGIVQVGRGSKLAGPDPFTGLGMIYEGYSLSTRDHSSMPMDYGPHLYSHTSNQVPSGRTTLVDCVLQCSSNGSGVWLRNSGTLVLHGCKVCASSSSAIQVGGGLQWRSEVGDWGWG